MTAQIEDIYLYQNTEYAIIAMSKPIRFRPKAYGLEPTAPHTACWQGYWCEYRVTDNKLFLDALHVYCADEHYPALFNVNADKPKSGDDFWVYRGLNHPMGYSGSIVLGDGFIDKYYIHMGFQRVWAYETVIELVFQRGRLVNQIDHSEFVGKLRASIESDPNFINNLKNNIPLFIETSFSLDTKDKVWWI